MFMALHIGVWGDLRAEEAAVGKRSLLVRMPVRPFDIEALLPSLHLAKLAAALQHLGYSAAIHDFGTPLHASTLAQAARRGLWLPGGFSGDRSCAARRRWPQHTAWAETLAQGTPPPLDVLVVYAEDLRDDLRWVRTFRRYHPRVAVLAAGPAVDRAGERRTQLLPVDGSVVMPGAHVPYGPPQYRCGMLRGRDDPAALLAAELEESLRRIPPDFGAGVYGALHAAGPESGKLQLLPVCGSGTAQDFALELQRLFAETGLRALCVVRSEWGGPETGELARILLAQERPFVYCVREADLPTEDISFTSLRASGCLAASYGVETGSQRLQRDFYGRQATMGAIERLLGRARRAGLGFATRLTFPCPADDWHTYAETLRFLERVRPDGVSVSEFAALPQAARSIAPVLRTSRRWLSAYDAHALIGGRGPLRGRAEELGAAAAAAGMPVGVDERLILIGKVLGSAEQMVAFAGRVQSALATGDLSALSALVDQFNSAVRATRPEPQQAHNAA